MSARMKERPTDGQAKVTVILPNSKKVFYISTKNYRKCESVLEKYSEENEKPIAWEVLAKDRIEKYKKAGLVLRGMRYRENISQKTLSEKSGIAQNVISSIENGKRTVGEKVAKKLAKVLNFDYHLLLEKV